MAKKKAKKVAKKSAARGKRPAKKVQRKGAARKAAPKKTAKRAAKKAAPARAAKASPKTTVSKKAAPQKSAKHSKTHGWICWHELQANDAHSAFDFYKNLFGWHAKQGTAGPDIPYLEFTAPGDAAPVGGVTKMQGP